MPLVLTRKESESILICDDITVTIDDIKGRKVRVEIDTPEEVNIVRPELSDDNECD